MPKYVAKRIRLRNGERHSVLQVPNGLPVHEVTLYLDKYRRKGRAANTIHFVCTSLALLYGELDRAKVNLLDRLSEGAFLTMPELSYTQILNVAPMARATLSKALQLLEKVGAIGRQAQGKVVVYTLNGIETPGKWCAFPQGYLLAGYDHLNGLKFFLDHMRRPATLHALKLYMLLLAQRTSRTNIAIISYSTIEEYTGMRREDISRAVSLLISERLCTLVGDDVMPRRKGDPMHNRYAITGLRAMGT